MADYPIKLVIVEDDEIIRNGFVTLLKQNQKFMCVADYDNCEDSLININVDKPDVVLMDIGLPGMSGIEGIKRLKFRNPAIDIIVVTVYEEDEKVFQALCAGASGYLTKNVSSKKLMDSIEEVYKGGAPMSTNIARKVVESFQLNSRSPLTPRETEVLQHLAKGKSYTMIADELFIDKETVRTHIKNIYFKLNVNSKAGAIEKASKEKFI